MKKIILAILVFLMPIMVLGVTCDFVEDKQETDNRELTCDLSKSTNTKYKTSSDVIVLDNSVCKVTCTEEIVFSIDPIKKVLSGTGLNYPLYASGERKCKAEYDYEAYEAKILKLTQEYASLTGTAKATKKNEITNYYDQKKACDNFTKVGDDKFNKYSYSGAKVSLKISTSSTAKTINYTFKDISEYSNKVILDEVNYSSCKFDESKTTCSSATKTIRGWTETARIYGKYTMPDVYLDRYTGEVNPDDKKTSCNAGDRYFIDFTEITKPVSSDKRDNGYSLTLNATGLGNNLKGKKVWDLKVNCWYQVKNLLLPQGGVTPKTDEGYDKFGSTAFQYRIVDLNDPFPNREAGSNWTTKDIQNIIYSTKDNLSNLQRFVIKLDRSSINKTRKYNSGKFYDTFNLDEMEKSAFIRDNPTIVIRK